MSLGRTLAVRGLKKLADCLPDSLYLKLYPRYWGMVDKPERPVTASFKRIGPAFLFVEDPESGRFYFYERSRMKLYWPNGVAKRLNHMRRKYRTDSVEVMPGDVVVDVGANIGEFTAAVHDVASKCFAFEPDPVAYRCLVANAQSLSKVTAFNVALSDKPGQMTFYLAAKSGDSSLVEPMVPYETSTIEAQTLDDIFPSFGVDAIDFLKVEAEGWEPEVLRGAEQTLRQKVRRVVVDGGPERKGQATSGDVIEILRDCGFNISRKGDIVGGFR